MCRTSTFQNIDSKSRCKLVGSPPTHVHNVRTKCSFPQMFVYQRVDWSNPRRTCKRQQTIVQKNNKSWQLETKWVVCSTKCAANPYRWWHATPNDSCWQCRKCLNLHLSTKYAGSFCRTFSACYLWGLVTLFPHTNIHCCSHSRKQSSTKQGRN